MLVTTNAILIRNREKLLTGSPTLPLVVVHLGPPGAGLTQVECETMKLGRFLWLYLAYVGISSIFALFVALLTDRVYLLVNWLWLCEMMCLPVAGYYARDSSGVRLE